MVTTQRRGGRLSQRGLYPSEAAAFTEHTPLLSHQQRTAHSRGIARRGADGELQLLVQDYPYAEDALPLWSVIATYVRDTLVRFVSSWFTHVGTFVEVVTMAGKHSVCVCELGHGTKHVIELKSSFRLGQSPHFCRLGACMCRAWVYQC